jgi:predicted transcriptional regulator of viral defense system
MNADYRTKRSSVGIDLVRRLAEEGDRIFSTARAREMAPQVGLKDDYLLEALYHLRRNGWIVQLRRGLYALTATVPGVTPVHEFEIAMALAKPAAVSHWSALHHHGLTHQVPCKVFVLTTTEVSPPRKRGAKAVEGSEGYKVGGAAYEFIRVKPKKFFGMGQVWIGEARVKVTDPERTLLDGLSRPQYCGDFSEVLLAFETRLASLELEKIIEYAIRLDGATAKRLGWVLEHLGVDSIHLDRLLAVPVKGYRKLDSTGPRRGPCDRRWMIQVNLPGRIET